ncbi:fimbrial biogenesis chaperone [Syntrophotalea carbinolica]|nr:fimbria/pilus periplasmic chaperone [Syntrophotalea carbinolica]
MDLMAGHDRNHFAVSFFSCIFSCAVLLFSLVFSSVGHAGQWRVAPVRITLDQRAASCVITVLNDGEDTVNLQGKAMVWTQDADGKDVYEETGDLIFFPRILMLHKGEQKIIRAGIKAPARSREKTYRLFLEEIPQAKADTSDATQLTVVIRFGIPVFVKPLKEEPAGELVSATLEKGELSAVVANTGNTHFRITDITVKGTDQAGRETFSEKLNGWYLLAGARRQYSLAVPAEKCLASEQLDISVVTDSDITINRSMDVDKAQCQP